MSPAEKIIELIDNGDPLPILAEDSIKENFNILFKHQLIDFTEGKVSLTEKGKIAKVMGMERFISELTIQEELQEFSEEVQKKGIKRFKMCLGLFLTVLALFLFFSL